MKKGMLFCIFVALFMFPLTSCDVSPSQAKVIAQNAGLASAVTWIAYDDPDQSEITTVRTVLTVIKGVTADTSEGATYTQVIFPAVENYLEEAVADGSIEANHRPIALAGSLALLNGIDLLFATNPEWNDNHTLARDVVDSFLLGAENGLNLADNDPRMVNARSSVATRARVFQK